MDGTLIDSELHWVDVANNFFRKRGLEYTKDIWAALAGKGMKETAGMIKNICNLPESSEQVFTEIANDTNCIYTTKAQAMTGSNEIICKMKEVGLKQAIASGSEIFRINKVMERLNWNKYFDHLISSEHVNGINKPDPAIYTYAAKVLNINPKDCVVFEDSENGVRSAKGAGMACIAVPDKRWSHGDFSMADLIADSLLDERIFHYIGINYV